MTAGLQQPSPDIEVMNNMVDLCQIARGIDPYCPYKRLDGGSSRDLRQMSLARRELDESRELIHSRNFVQGGI